MLERRVAPLKLGKNDKRGVSPIIATILLVAITVVIAAVLYVLVSGYLSGTGSSPMTIELANPSGFTVPATEPCSGPATDNVVTFASLTASSSMTTADFGLKIVDVNKAPVAFTCAELENSGGVVQATFSDSSGKWSSTASVSNSDSMVFETVASLAGTGDQIQAYGLGSNSVSGGYTAGF